MSYTYLKNEEWLDPNKVDNSFYMNELSDKIINSYRTSIKTTGNKNLEELINLSGKDLTDITNYLVEKNTKVENKNRNHINTVLKNNVEGDAIISELIKKKYKLEKQVDNISTVLSKNLNKSEYLKFLRRPKIETSEFSFKVIDTDGDIPESPENLINYGNTILDQTIKFSDANVKKEINKIRSELMESISFGMSWKNTNLALHGLGSLQDLMILTYYLLKNERNTNLSLFDNNNKPIPETSFLVSIFEPYFEKNQDMLQFIQSIRLKGYDIAKNKILLYSENITSNSYEDSSKVSNTESVINIIGKALTKIDEPIVNNSDKFITDVAKEFLVVVFRDIMENTLDNLKDIIKKFNEFQDRKLDDKYKYQVQYMMKNLENLDNLFASTVYEFFGLNNKNISSYGIDQGSRNKNAKPKTTGQFMIRVLGGVKHITSLHSLRPLVYPIIVKSTADPDKFDLDGDETVSRLIDIFFKARYKNIPDNETIYIGGFILEPTVGKYSIELVHEYFNRLEKIKRRNVVYINQILKRMVKGLHISDLKQMRDNLEKEYKGLFLSGNNLAKEIKAKTIFTKIGGEYRKYRTLEMNNLINLYIIDKFIKEHPTLMGKKVKANQVNRLRDSALAKVGHFQMKATIYKKMALVLLMKHGNKKGNNSKFVSLLDTTFESIDKQLLTYLSDRANNTKMYNAIKNSLKNISDVEVNRKTSKNKNNKNNKSKKNKNKKKKPEGDISDVNVKWSVSNKSSIETKTFWKNVKRKLKDKTIFIPFVDVTVGKLRYQYGFFDLIKSAIDGKIKETFIMGDPSNHIIYGSKINYKELSHRIRDIGFIMVTNSKKALKDEKIWRCIRKRLINEMKKLSAKDLRRKIFNILSNKQDYIDSTPLLWVKSSDTKQKILKYCNVTYSKDYTRCPILISRNGVVNKVQ